jgi:hypothetical protein
METLLTIIIAVLIIEIIVAFVLKRAINNWRNTEVCEKCGGTGERITEEYNPDTHRLEPTGEGICECKED